MTCVAIWAVGFGTPPCLSKNLAKSCSEYVSTIVMQDDIVPRLSVASLTRLRSEIVRTDWTDVFEKEDYKRVIDWIENAKQALFMVQDVGQKFSQFANFRNLPITSADIPTTKVGHLPTSRRTETEELYVPGILFYLKKHMDIDDGKQKCGVTYSLWKMQAHELVQRILLLGNLINDHKCDNHYYALREVLKGLPSASDVNNLNVKYIYYKE
ncbi:hypothetical protein ZOSMA_235G00230 [Zostera marina]|uniref:Uncharacterized protein n=1 Tax=Zostera marina TaxID=29655 RepID=A0A0K9PI49_ZOSMR|nr:hypothetical protein ZOSMA_235G00230 [Zostera marina]